VANSYFDECEVPVEEHRSVFMERLSLIDGRRATWTRMLDDGRSGHGLIPWVSNVDWWDQISDTASLTWNKPDLSPGFVQWRAPTEDDVTYFADVDFPFVVVEDEHLYAFNTNEDICHPMLVNCANNEEYWPVEVGHKRAFPLWAVTPIDEDYYYEWKNISFHHWRTFPELRVIPYLYTDFDECDASDQCFNSLNYMDRAYIHTHRPDEINYCYRCDMQAQDIERLGVTMTDRLYFPNLPEPFPDVWKWGVHRYIDGWYTVNEYLEEFPCRSSWASLLSPYSDTQHFGDLTIEKERASSIPSTSFQLSLESLIAG